MVYMDLIEGKWRLAKAYSADGIHWRMNVGEPAYFAPPVWPNGEVFGWDPEMVGRRVGSALRAHIASECASGCQVCALRRGDAA